MRFFSKKRSAEISGPRKNQWKDLQGEGLAKEVSRVKRTKRRTFARQAVVLTSVALLGSLITIAVNYSNSMVQQLLEIRTITVEGAQHIDKRKVIELAEVKPGMLLHHVATTAIEGRIESHPWIKQAEVSRVPFHELKITVIERKPAVIVRAESQNFLSDEEGYVLTKLGHDDETFPLVTGIDLRALLQGTDSVRRSIMSGIELARVIGQTFDGRLQVHAENPTNLVAFIQGVRFQFGEEALAEQWERFRRVKHTLKPLNFDGVGHGVSEVDLRYENRIVVREGGG